MLTAKVRKEGDKRFTDILILFPAYRDRRLCMSGTLVLKALMRKILARLYRVSPLTESMK